MRAFNMKLSPVIPFSLLMTSTLAVAGTPAAVKPLASITIPASQGKYDILRVDTKRHRLLGAHEEDKSEDCFDLSSNKLLTRIKLGAAVDTAWDPDSKHYYVSVQDAQRVAVVDADTLKETGSVKVGGPTDAIIYEPKNHMVYVTHDDGTNVWVIDPATLKLVGSVEIPGAPEFMEYDPSADRIYLNIKTKDSVVAIDPATNKVVSEWPTAPAERPHGIALSPTHHLIFVAGANGKLVAVDSTTGKVVATADIAQKVDQIAYDAKAGVLFAAGAGAITVIRVNGTTLTSAGEIQTPAGARTTAVDPATGAVWITYSDGKSSFAKSWTVQAPSAP
jgi:DNA-binding beta-propeller fold protein YncE